MDDKFVGKRLDGRYEIHNLIGVGGMAYVYRAYDRMENRWVAIKILKEELAKNSDFLRRFRNEAKAITLLSHPNIVEVYDVSFGDRLQYIVMEYIDGITLKQYIEQEGTVRWNEAVHFTIQILEALKHAHAKGIIHRDIKPQNIMLLEDGTIKVGDFGIARFLESETQTMTDKAIGSVHYISPEQARGDYITERADIYSVGVMLYEMITGRLPFVADTAVSVALMQLEAEPVMPRKLNPSLPRGLEQITMKAMEKNPVDRFQSAREMLIDLERFRRDPNTVFYYDSFNTSGGYDPSLNQRNTYREDSRREKYDDSYEYEEELVRSARSARGAMVVKGILVAVIIIGIAVGGVWLSHNWESLIDTPEDVQFEMPQFVGMLYEDIVNNPEYSGNFSFTTTQGFDPDKPAGEVLRQTPDSGIMVKKGREVELLVNGATPTVEVPDLRDYPQAEAISVLKEYGISCRSENVNDDTIAIGHVVGTEPAAGSSVDEGTVITLKVSKGPAVKKVKVPDGLRGDLLYNVTARLQDAGLEAGNITYDDESTEQRDVVLSTNPAEGSEVSEKSTVDIVVSSGKGAEKELSYELPMPSGVNMDLVMNIYRNGTLVDSFTVNPAYAPSQVLKFSGTTGQDTITVELDGQIYAQAVFDYDAQTTACEVYQFLSVTDPGFGYIPGPYQGGENGNGNVQPAG